MSFIINNGRILIRNGKIAVDPNCCCGLPVGPCGLFDDSDLHVAFDNNCANDHDLTLVQNVVTDSTVYKRWEGLIVCGFDALNDSLICSAQKLEDGTWQEGWTYEWSGCTFVVESSHQIGPQTVEFTFTVDEWCSCCPGETITGTLTVKPPPP